MDDAPLQPGHDLQDEARTVARGLQIAATALVVPATIVAIGAATGFLVLAVVAGTALLDGGTIARWVVLGLALAGIVVVAVFVRRVRVTWRAAREPEALAAELVALVDIEALTTAVLADLAEVTAHEGGLRAVSRARALWRLLRRLDVQEHVSQFGRARWFVPPDTSVTWLLAQWTTWGGLVAWVLVPAVSGARLAHWL